jgi:repressor LexA
MTKVKKTELGEFIKKKAEEKGFESLRQLAYASDVSNSEISRICSGERIKPNPRILQKLARALNTSYENMLDLAGYLSKNKITTTLPEDIDPVKNIALLPVIRVIRAGQPIYTEKNIIGVEPIHPDFLASGEYFFLQVLGNSMIGSGIRDGSFVLVRMQEQVENGDIAVIMVNDENATVKRVYFNDKLNSIVLQSDNSEYAPQIYPTKDVRIIGKVIRAIINPNTE